MTSVASSSAQSAQRSVSQFASKRLSFIGTLRSEILKFRSLTSNWVMLGVMVLSMVGLAMATASALNNYWNLLDDSEKAMAASADGVAMLTAQQLENYAHGIANGGVQLTNMLIASLAVVFIASEYSTRSVQATLVTVPKRSMVYLAKFLVISCITFVFSFVVSALSYYVARPILIQEIQDATKFESGVIVNWVGIAFYFTLMAWMGLGAGALLRNSIGAIVCVVALLFVVQLIFQFFPWEWAVDFREYLPSALGTNITTYGLDSDADPGYTKSGWILAAWGAGPALLGYLRFRLTDSKS